MVQAYQLETELIWSFRALHCTALHCIALHCTALITSSQVLAVLAPALPKRGRVGDSFTGWFSSLRSFSIFIQFLLTIEALKVSCSVRSFP